MAPARGSSIGVRTNTIEGVKPERGWRPFAGTREKILAEDPEEFITDT